MNATQRIVKNISVSGISQITIYILGFFLLIYIARYLGEAEFGVYSFAISFTSLFLIFSDIGINQLIIRDIARNKKITNQYVTNSLIIKLILSFFTFALIALSINLLQYPQNVINVVYLFGIYTILSSFAQLFMSIFQAHEKMEYNAVVIITEKIILISVGISVLILGYGLIQLAYVYVFAGIIETMIGLLIFSLKIGKTNNKIEFSIWKTLTTGSIPFGLNSFFGMLFFKIDTVLLSLLKNDVAVGIYNAAYNPLLALSSIVSGIISSTIYPAMSKYFISSSESLEIITILSSKYLAIIGFPVAVLCLILADKFISLFYGNLYSESIFAFQILALFIPIRLISSITGTFLTSINKQSLRTISVVISSFLNIILNLILIPYISYIGACIATVLSEIILYFLFIYFINRYYKKIKLNKILLKPFLASLIIGILIFYLRDINLFLSIVLAIFVYLGLLILFNTFSTEDRVLLKGILKR
jgi:O-antigen/teichoic acid export membrane protein